VHALTDAGSKYIPEGGASLDGGASLRLKKRCPDEQAGEPEEQRSRPTCCSCGRHVERCRDATGRRAGTSAGRDGTIATALRGSIGHLAERVSRLRIIRLKCRAVGLPWSIALQTRRGIVLATRSWGPRGAGGRGERWIRCEMHLLGVCYRPRAWLLARSLRAANATCAVVRIVALRRVRSAAPGSPARSIPMGLAGDAELARR